MTLGELLACSVSAFPDRVALVEADRNLTYRQLASAVAALKRMLRREFPEGGVALQFPNCIEFVCAFLAASVAGLRVLLLDPRFGPGEVRRYCGIAGIRKALVREPEAEDAPHDTLARIAIPRLDQLFREGEQWGPRAPRRQGEVLLLSSGTTGPPKIVRRTPAQMEAALGVFADTVPYGPADRLLAVLPFCHSFGLCNVLLAGLRAGAEVHIEPFAPRSAATAIQQHRITVLPAAPILFRLLARTHFDPPPDFGSLRCVLSAGAALPPAVLEAFRDAFGVGISESYGSTETGPVSLAPPGDGPPEPSRVGRPYEGVQVEIRDARAEPLPDGREGEIWVRSPANFAGYLGQAPSGGARIRGEYVGTGDMGYRDGRGELYVTGRRKRMANVAGKKVSLCEVEERLRRHPAVADVSAVAGCGPTGREIVKALVVRTGPVSAMELRAFCAEELADFKVPREIEFVDESSNGSGC